MKLHSARWIPTADAGSSKDLHAQLSFAWSGDHSPVGKNASILLANHGCLMVPASRARTQTQTLRGVSVLNRSS